MVLAKCLQLYYVDEDQYEHSVPQSQQQQQQRVELSNKKGTSKSLSIINHIFELPNAVSIPVQRLLTSRSNQNNDNAHAQPPASSTANTTRTNTLTQRILKRYEKIIHCFVSHDISTFIKTMNEHQEETLVLCVCKILQKHQQRQQDSNQGLGALKVSW